MASWKLVTLEAYETQRRVNGNHVPRLRLTEFPSNVRYQSGPASATATTQSRLWSCADARA